MRIASDLLGSGATSAEVVAESNHLYHLNRDEIGDDPNVLIAGTVFRLRKAPRPTRVRAIVVVGGRSRA